MGSRQRRVKSTKVNLPSFTWMSCMSETQYGELTNQIIEAMRVAISMDMALRAHTDSSSEDKETMRQTIDDIWAEVSKEMSSLEKDIILC